MWHWRRRSLQEQLARSDLGGTLSVWRRTSLQTTGFSLWRGRPAFSRPLICWWISLTVWASTPMWLRCWAWNVSRVARLGSTRKKPTESIWQGSSFPSQTGSARESDAPTVTWTLRQVHWRPTNNSSMGWPVTYRIFFPRGAHDIAFPVGGCPVRATIRSALWVHFLRCNLQYMVVILEEEINPLPHYPKCDMFVTCRKINVRYQSTAMWAREG